MKTVFVVGAGASDEVGLPLGNALREKVAQALACKVEHGQITKINAALYPVYQILLTGKNQRDINAYLMASDRICRAMPSVISIDNFLDISRGDDAIEICGKLAIAHCILKAEASSTLFVDRQKGDLLNFKRLEPTWFGSFFKLLTENCHLNDLASRLSSIAFVIFNYDRCVEHFLLHALRNLYDISEEQATELILKIEIFHPYGMVGKLPWQSGKIAFGANPNPVQLLEVAQGLRTFTEQIDENSAELVSTRNTLREAKRVVFLGFAFHQQNVSLLMPSNVTMPMRTSVYGTSLGLSHSDAREVSTQLSNLFQCEARLENVKSAELFGEYWRSLSLSRKS